MTLAHEAGMGVCQEPMGKLLLLLQAMGRGSLFIPLVAVMPCNMMAGTNLLLGSSQRMEEE